MSFICKAAIVAFGCTLVSAALIGCKAPAQTQLGGRQEPVPLNYFDMHIHRATTTTPWPPVTFGVLRLWDTETTWAHLEPRRGEWNFATLDQLVKLAETHHTKVILTFGRTPAWAVGQSLALADPKAIPARPPASMDDWRQFVSAVATRYKGRIDGYEIWNEPNLRDYYNGDVATLVEMTRVASEAIRAIDPAAQVISPSPTQTSGLAWLDSFLAAGGGRYVDVIAFHLYVTPQPPEQMVPLAQGIRSRIAHYNLMLPIWNTETGWAKPKNFASGDEQGAYVARSLLLGWAVGIDRFFWYAWDNRNWVTLNLSEGNDYHSTPAAAAYSMIEHWMLGKRLEGCAERGDGVWSCTFVDEKETTIIFWSPVGEVPFLDKRIGRVKTVSLSALNGQVRSIKADALRAGPAPQMILIQTR